MEYKRRPCVDAVLAHGLDHGPWWPAVLIFSFLVTCTATRGCFRQGLNARLHACICACATAPIVLHMSCIITQPTRPICHSAFPIVENCRYMFDKPRNTLIWVPWLKATSIPSDVSFPRLLGKLLTRFIVLGWRAFLPEFMRKRTFTVPE
jgi:hypothetical protein